MAGYGMKKLCRSLLEDDPDINSLINVYLEFEGRRKRGLWRRIRKIAGNMRKKQICLMSMPGIKGILISYDIG